MTSVAGRYSQQKVTILVAASESDWLDTLGYRIAGIYVPAATEGDEVGFIADPTGDGVGATVVNSAGAIALVVYGSSLPSMANVPIDLLPPAARYKLVTRNSGAADVPIVQAAADAVITVILEHLRD